MPLRLHYDVEITVTGGRRMKLHRDVPAERAPRRGDMLFIDIFRDDPIRSRRVRVGEVLWNLDCSKATVGLGPLEELPPASLERLMLEGWSVASD